MEGIDKIGFDVGWDHAEYGVHVPESVMGGTLADGYNAAVLKIGRGRTKEADRYVRKWLQLRRNAWKRERIFSEDVSPEFIRAISVPHCPITREKLTFSTGEDTDWSVDRLINDGGYVRGNLVVMSTRANKAKDSLTTRDIVAKVAEYDASQQAFFLNDTPLPGLTSDETMRLYTLTLIPSAGEILLSSRVFMPPAVPCGSIYVFQCYLTALALLGTVKDDVKADLRRVIPGVGGLNKVIRKITNAGRSKLRARIAEKTTAKGIPLHFDDLMWTAEDVWAPNTGVYEAFHSWVWTTPKPQFDAMMDGIIVTSRKYGLGLGARRIGTRVDPAQFSERIGEATGGYIRHD
jgi:hypothetical protein